MTESGNNKVIEKQNLSENNTVNSEAIVLNYKCIKYTTK